MSDPEADRQPSASTDEKDTMIRAIRQEILLLRGSHVAKQARRLSDKTIEKVDRREWATDNSCRQYLEVINKGLAEAHKNGQLDFAFEELEMRDLFEPEYRGNQQLWRAIPGPRDGEPRKRGVKAFLREKSAEKKKHA